MPDKYDERLYAKFEPSDALLLAGTSNNNLLVEFPTLASALAMIFPYLLLIDNFLEIITWTNDDPYQNFLFVILYLMIVMQWHFWSMVILPICLALAFSCIVWSVSSVVYDSKFDEKPTIDEVVYTLNNITVRFEMLLRPVQHIPFKFKNYVKMLGMSGLLTPLHIFILKKLISPQKYVWLCGLFVLTYHSPWSFTLRRLLWRSVYIRIFAVYITGVDVKLRREKAELNQPVSVLQSPALSDTEDNTGKVNVLSDFKILKKTMVSSTQFKQEVLFQVLENERRWFGLGWTNKLLPNERTNFVFERSLNPIESIFDDLAKFPFPMFENDLYKYEWKWLDEKWSLDRTFSGSSHMDGWLYYDKSWGNPRSRDGFSKYTRARRWVRKAALMIDKRETTYDE